MSMYEDCGTYAAYQRHKKQGTPADAACRQASAEYMREYRAQRPATREKERLENAARTRALHRLGRLYPGDFRRLYAEELKRPTSSRVKDVAQ